MCSDGDPGGGALEVCAPWLLLLLLLSCLRIAAGVAPWEWLLGSGSRLGRLWTSSSTAPQHARDIVAAHRTPPHTHTHGVRRTADERRNLRTCQWLRAQRAPRSGCSGKQPSLRPAATYFITHRTTPRVTPRQAVPVTHLSRRTCPAQSQYGLTPAPHAAGRGRAPTTATLPPALSCRPLPPSCCCCRCCHCAQRGGAPTSSCNGTPGAVAPPVRAIASRIAPNGPRHLDVDSPSSTSRSRHGPDGGGSGGSQCPACLS